MPPGALVVGVAGLWGYFGLCIAAAMVIGAVPYTADRRGFSGEPAVVGVVQAFALGCGFLFVHLYTGFLSSTLDNLLFGTFLGVTDDQVLVLAAVAAAALATLAVIGRPLLFSSVDPSVAAARGVPVRALSAIFLVVLAVAVAEISQITGALLVFALLVMPPAAAQQLTSRSVDRPGPERRHRRRRGVARRRRVVLLPLSDRVLHHHLRVRRLRRGGGGQPGAGTVGPAPRRAAAVASCGARSRGGAVTDPLTGVVHLLAHGFIDRAFLLGTPVAAACGLVGWFVVLRAQVFTGDALSHVAFTGALAALAAGIDLRVGLFAGCVIFSVAMAALGARGRPDDVVIGSTFAWILGLGVLFLTLYATSRSRGQRHGRPQRPVRFHLRPEPVPDHRRRPHRRRGGGGRWPSSPGRCCSRRSTRRWRRRGACRCDCSAPASSSWWASPPAKPPRRWAPCCSSACCPPPAATAHALTDRPWAGVALSVALAVAAMWIGIAVSYAAPDLPVSFSIIAVATALYVAALARQGPGSGPSVPSDSALSGWRSSGRARPRRSGC